MSEQRTKSDSILLRIEGKTYSVELFPAAHWPLENGGPGLYRVRIASWPAGSGPGGGRGLARGALPPAANKPESECPAGSGAEGYSTGVWHIPSGKYSFLSRSAIGALVATLLHGGELVEEAAPYLPEKADVLVHLDGAVLREAGSVRVAPYQKRDGRWWCQVWVFGKGGTEVCCNDVTLVRVRG